MAVLSCIDSVMAMTEQMTAEHSTEKYMVPALERGLRLLQEFGHQNETLGAPELARRLELPRATIFRMLNTLEAMGFLQRVGGGSDYRLGLAVLRLGFSFLSSMDLTELGQPIIEKLCQQIQFPCNVVVRDGRFIVYVAKVTPQTLLSSSVRVGTRLPAHATVLGRVLLGDLDLEQMKSLYPEEQLVGHTAHTPQTVEELFALVEADLARGYVAGSGFYESTISTIAAPVRDHTGHVVAAIGATLGTADVSSEQVAQLVPQVCAAADELSELLNYRPSAGLAVSAS